MTPDRIEEAAGLFRKLRGDFRTIAALPEELRPTSLEEGYAIQDAFVRGWETPVGGWKIACTAADQREFLGVDEPFSGRVFTNVLGRSPTEMSAGAFHMRGVECEFAFRMARDLAPRTAPYTRDEVAAAVASLHPAVEIVDSRFDDWLAVGAPSLVADNAVNGALVCGEGERNWRRYDLENFPVQLRLDGRLVAEGTGGRAYGHPLDALTWLANNLSGRGLTLEAGQFVTTGTCAGIHFVEAGVDVRADFDALGAVRINFGG